jgi:ribosomal protein S18 acetylase RimI-like enzyme
MAHRERMSEEHERKEAMTENLKSAPGGEWIDALEIGALGPADAGVAVDLLSRGMRDNPLHVAVFGEDPERRQRRLRRVFAGAFDSMGWQTNMLAARDADGTILGLCGAMPPGGCQLELGQQLRLMPRMFANGPDVALRTLRWLGAWGKRDPEGRHWHLGPVAVDAHLQGRGVGSRLMEVFCARVDAAGDDAYLETDKPANVSFYERFGFEVVGEQEVLGVPNWFMSRTARVKGASG